ncbi:hypothetical protein AAF712_014525 [Marasmius tenuissimus]|uniref:Uncharacterized protein n=1 Tax=Marasmius tenuissimus TaxID=585030 RepID=A0ABR2ZDE9_9AGAR
MKGKSQTRGERYESLLLRTELGCPLWMPSPQRTSDGVYMPEIGDVGILAHGLPFKTLFNITKSRAGLANKGSIPEGVEPPCILQPQSIITQEGYHTPRTTLIQPEGAISKLVAEASGTSSVFTFHLSDKEGALLMLPHGGTLQKLENTSEFEKRAQHHWRHWYEFADQQGDLHDSEALCLVTGVERCTTWAMAAWDSDSASTCVHDDLGSLTLTVNGTTGACEWASPPARCSTQSSESAATNGLQPNQETVFIRGLWIDRLDGKLWPPAVPPWGPGEENDSHADRNPRSRGGSRRQAPSSDPSAEPSSSNQSSHSPGRCSAGSSPLADPLGLQIDEEPIPNPTLNFPGEGEPNLVACPCRIINRFALKLLSKVKPALLDTGCAAFSHDNDWISIIHESDQGIPPEAELIRRICSNFKFTIEGDAIHTVSMTDPEKELFAERLEALSPQSQGSAISVSVESDRAVVSPSLPQHSTYEDSSFAERPTAHSWDDITTRVTMRLGSQNPNNGEDQDSNLRGAQIDQTVGKGGVYNEGRDFIRDPHARIVNSYERLLNAGTDVGASHKEDQQLVRGASLEGNHRESGKACSDWHSTKDYDHPICRQPSGVAAVGKFTNATVTTQECEKESGLVSSFSFQCNPKCNKPFALWPAMLGTGRSITVRPSHCYLVGKIGAGLHS